MAEVWFIFKVRQRAFLPVVPQHQLWLFLFLNVLENPVLGIQ